MDRYELAWAAGFFDGEGWAGTGKSATRVTRQPRAQVNQAGESGIPATLVRFQAALGGVGRISGPYVVRGRKDLYRWVASSRGDVELVHHLLVPWLGAHKLNAFAYALERRPAASRSVQEVTDEWRAWGAGLFDGEGSICLVRHRSHEGRQVGEIAVTQASEAGAPEVLERIQRIIAMGVINGPYAQANARRAIYRWKVVAQDEIASAMTILGPWLSEVKRRQTEDVLAALRDQEPLLRGNPAWGNRKTHCVRGHEYATARVRAFVPRNGGTEPSRQRAVSSVRARRCPRAAREKEIGRR